MGDFDNSNNGALFKNDKIQSDRSPQYRGDCATVCEHCGKKTEFWMSAWIKQAKGKATKFMSLAFTQKESQAPKPDLNDFDDDIPFSLGLS